MPGKRVKRTPVPLSAVCSCSFCDSETIKAIVDDGISSNTSSTSSNRYRAIKGAAARPIVSAVELSALPQEAMAGFMTRREISR